MIRPWSFNSDQVDENSNGFDAKRWDLEFEFKNTKGGPEAVEAELSDATPMRAWAIAKAFELGMSVADVPQAERMKRRL